MSGARFAKAECANCYGLFEKPQMYKFEQAYSVGGGVSKYYNKDGKYTGESRRSSVAKSKSIWLCDDCNRQLVDRESGVLGLLNRLIRVFIHGVSRA